MTFAGQPICSSSGRRPPEERTSFAHLLHALNQPLAAVHCALEVGLLGDRSAAEYRRFLHQALAQIGRAFQIVAAIRECANAAASSAHLQSPRPDCFPTDPGNPADRKPRKITLGSGSKRRLG